MDKLLLSTKNYNIKTWVEKYPNYNVDLTKLEINTSWGPFFKKHTNKKYWKELNRYLSYCFKSTLGKINIYPYPDLIFNSLNFTPLDQIKVLILGQDSFHQNACINGKIIPQAMGLSFSVPVGIKIPPSLKNIYKNLIKFNHIIKEPSHGNLTFWASQGCLLLNTSLTVQHNHANSHSKYWMDFTNDLIKYISDNLENIIFVLWGAHAFKKKKDLYIDSTKHKVIVSSHPSPLSFNKPFGKYKSFMEVDHFGKINKFLTKTGKNPIIWQIS